MLLRRDGTVCRYKILSPKDPFQTVARVLAPWADIARPSRVQITDVQPGNSAVYHGQVVNVSAIVIGIRESPPVPAIYSTADGQTVDQAGEMSPRRRRLVTNARCRRGKSTALVSAGRGEPALSRPAASSERHLPHRRRRRRNVRLPADRRRRAHDHRRAAGIQLSGLHEDSRRNRPSAGRHQGLEGTQVTIHAVANQPVKSPGSNSILHGKMPPPKSCRSSPMASMPAGTISSSSKPTGARPGTPVYQVRFYNERGQPSQQPIQHKIEVLRDLPPEVQILQPERLRIEVPEDGEQTIEVRAVDPDFGLPSVRIEGFVGGKPAGKLDLLESTPASRLKRPFLMSSVRATTSSPLATN